MDKNFESFFRFEKIRRQFDTSRYLEESALVEQGNILIITGPSGSGKSTLLKILARLTKSDYGEVYWHGKNWQGYSPIEWRSGIQFVSQKPIIFPGSIIDNFALPFSLKNKKGKKENMDLILYYMDKVGLSPQMLHQEGKTLSGGEAARIALIRALVTEPEILLLDEPTAFLDHETRIMTLGTINEWVKGQSRAAIIVSHQEEDLKHLDYEKIIHCPIRKAV